MKKQDMNLLARYEEINKIKASQYSDKKIFIIVIAVVTLLLGAFSIKLLIDNSILKKDIASIEKYVNDTNVQQRLTNVNQLQSDLDQIELMLDQVNSINDVFDAGVRFDSRVLNMLYYEQPYRVYLENISYSNGLLSVLISGPNAYDASNYVLRLEESGYFKTVKYSGYVYNESDGRYYATLQCIMKGGN